MAIHFKTNTPQALLNAFKKAIDEKLIVTWSCDTDGDFTHTPDQWRNKAWLRPHVRTGELVLTIIKPEPVNISSLVYAVYHGRFIESMLQHCDTLFSEGVATALPTTEDRIS
ncbi:MAG: hypothetical protein WAN50_05030 [Minisyncoccia bacterium]